MAIKPSFESQKRKTTTKVKRKKKRKEKNHNARKGIRNVKQSVALPNCDAKKHNDKHEKNILEGIIVALISWQ